MKLRLLLGFFLVLNLIYSQENKVKTDKSGNIIGFFQKEDLLKEPYKDWYDFAYDDYMADETVTSELKRHLKKVEIKVFMGTWCGDSQEQVPVFFNILDAVNFKYKNMELIGVNRSKKTPDRLEKGLNIIRVPTFIFYKKGKELGRIVEFPQETLEADMLKILKGEAYQHSYEVQ
jgi:thiol-disulfide isomerase/thioredoxin